MKDKYYKEMVNKYKKWHENIKKWTIFYLSRYICFAWCHVIMHSILDAAQLTYHQPLSNNVLQEFRHVFSEEILGLPPKRDIDFTIELAPGAAPVSKAP